MSLNQDTSLPINLTGSDNLSGVASYAVLTNPAHGSLSGTAPNFTYTPTAGYSGTDSFPFKTTDIAGNDSTVATVSITVVHVNHALVAFNQSVTTAYKTAVNITLTATDPDNDPLTYTVLTLPAYGTLTGAAPNLTYTPAGNYSGPDSFTFKANDGSLDSNTATVSIKISAPPAPTPTSVTFNPSSVGSGQQTQLTITLSGPSTGQAVSLASSNPAVVSVPGSVTILAGQTSYTLTITAGSVSKKTNVTVTGTLNSVNKNATVTISP